MASAAQRDGLCASPCTPAPPGCPLRRGQNPGSEHYFQTLGTAVPGRGVWGDPQEQKWSHQQCLHAQHPSSSTGKHNCPQGLLRRIVPGFPGGAVVESLPASAGDTGSCPGLGGSHMPRSGWAREPQLLSLRVWSLCSAAGGAAIVRGLRTAMKSGPRLPQLEKALAQKRRPNTAINK